MKDYIEEAMKTGAFGFSIGFDYLPGAFADIVLFDFKEIRDMNDFLNQNRPPQGIEYVLLNGTVVYKNMTHTGKKPGKVLGH